MSKQDSELDINVDETQNEQNSHTPETLQIHNTYNTTMHDKDDLIHDENNPSENENTIEIETFGDYGEKIHETEEFQIKIYFNFISIFKITFQNSFSTPHQIQIQTK